jgi:hypothetical protein
MASQTPDAFPPPRAFKPDNMITLLVGPEEQAMVVHGDCLSRDSEFFRTALKKEWGEGRAIKLPEETPLLMGYYIEHLYGVKLPTHKLTSGPSINDSAQPVYELLASLYVLGERMMDSEYRNMILQEFLRLLDFSLVTPNEGCWPGTRAVSIIYQGTTAESPARRMMVDFAVKYGTPHTLEHFASVDSRYPLSVGRSLLQKLQDRDEGRHFRWFPMKAEDYIVAEDR